MKGLLPLVAFIVLLASCSSGDAPTPSVTPTATPTAAVTDASARPTLELTLGAPFSLSPGTTLYATRHCYWCGIPPWAVYRLQADETDQIVSTSLLDSLTANVEQDAEDPISERDGPAILGVHVRPDGSEILAEVCVAGKCGDKCYKAHVSEDAKINVYSSRDDGLTWSVSMTLVPYDYVDGIWDDGRIVVSNCYEKTARLIPGDEPIPYPIGPTPSLVTGGGAARFADGSFIRRSTPSDKRYLVRELPDEGVIERFRLPVPGRVTFRPRLSDSEQFISLDWESYVIDWDDYELHAFDTGISDPGQLWIVGVRQD